jgi:hypothetical protein
MKRKINVWFIGERDVFRNEHRHCRYFQLFKSHQNRFHWQGIIKAKRRSPPRSNRDGASILLWLFGRASQCVQLYRSLWQRVWWIKCGMDILLDYNSSKQARSSQSIRVAPFPMTLSLQSDQTRHRSRLKNESDFHCSYIGPPSWSKARLQPTPSLLRQPLSDPR